MFLDEYDDHDRIRLGAKIQRFYELLFEAVEVDKHDEKNILLTTLIEDYERMFEDVLEG